MDLTKVCYPDYVVTDGVAAMEGFGPSGGTWAFCKGCPPVPSQIARTIDAGKILDD